MRLAADANVLLSAVLGGRAQRILDSPQIDQILTVESIMAEVEEYATLLARKKHLAEDLVLLAVGALPVTVVSHDEYAAAIPEAMSRIGRRALDDAELLALAISFDLPVWSNDKDFRVLESHCTQRNTFYANLDSSRARSAHPHNYSLFPARFHPPA